MFDELVGFTNGFNKLHLNKLPIINLNDFDLFGPGWLTKLLMLTYDNQI